MSLIRTPERAEEVHEPLDQRAAFLAGKQHGVFSRAQLQLLGATRRAIQHRLEIGRWERVVRGVFRLAGVAPTWRQKLMMAALYWGEGSGISHRAAAALHRLAGFEPDKVHVTIPRSRKGAGPGIVHRNNLPPVDLTEVEGIPVTTAARTLIDIAPIVSRDALEEALDDGLRRGVFSIPRLRWRLDELGRRRGAAVLRNILDERAPQEKLLQSVLERRVLRLIRRAGLPEPVLQYKVRYRGRLIAIVDFAYPDTKLAIEADGEPWHSGHFREGRDRTRANRLTAMGWRLIRVTSEDLKRRPESIGEAIRRALTLPS